MEEMGTKEKKEIKVRKEIKGRKEKKVIEVIMEMMVKME